ncbi:heparinase II/III domain-containing protein [Paenibacillus nasutitermitis]|uniref:Heparinase II/III-like C-terminal domain-containing protein n=1 Tax=Paenibacillus nasutitermitis TaxID=1652958 RepID=A0A916YKX5_9BACL|nr:heparinase II/III family protein [Paenibacillus nasutitermitis]GGD49531.1 hypothetical protein GCM10010911_03800 [Paenibacillus nasutitermitis]
MTAPRIWDLSSQHTLSLLLDPITGAPKSLSIPIHSSAASMSFIETTLRDEDDQIRYRAQIVVEWTGDHLLEIPANWFEPVGSQDMSAILTQLTLTCWDSGPLSAMLTVDHPVWTEHTPLIQVNEREQLLDVFTAPGFWEPGEWEQTSGEGAFKKMWLYAQLSTQSGPEQSGSVAYTKQYDRPIDQFQALVLGLSTDELGAFSLQVMVDGVNRLVVDRKPGSGFEELRVDLAGKLLNSVTIGLSTDPGRETGEQEGKLICLIYWIMLESRGEFPAITNEITGSGDIVAPTEEVLAGAAVYPVKEAGLHEQMLPVGFLFDREGLLALRKRVFQKGSEASRLFGEIRAEAEANLSYRPEDYLGTYMPVDWARQGIERASSPNSDTHRLFSTLVYSAFAYAIEGDLRFGLAARRALLTVARIKHWAAGFVARYPAGLRGYRAPFIESHTSQAVALCYDLICPLLTPEERREVEDALYTKGMIWLDAFLRQNGEGYLLGSNQGAVYTLGLLYAAHAAARSHPDAAAVAQRWSSWLERMLAGYYHADGSTNEGMMYWEYTTHYAIESLLIISGQSGRPVSGLIPPSMAQTMDYLSHLQSLAYPSLRFLALGDCRNEDFNNLGPSLLFFSRYLGDTRSLAMWQQHYAIAHPPGNPFFGLPIGTGQYTTNGLLTLLLLQDEKPVKQELPKHRIFAETERILWRTGSNFGDKLFFFEGGPQSFEHTHYDKGQFLLEAFGETLVVDPGTITYNRPFSTLLKASKFHNVVTVNGKDQSYKDPSQAVGIKALREEQDYDYLHADLTHSYQELSVYNRRILFVRPDYWLLYDEVDAIEPGLEWNLHSKGMFFALEPDGRSLHFIAQAPQAGLRVAVAADQSLTAKTATYSDEGVVLSHHLALHTGRSAAKLRLAAILCPYAGEDENAVNAITIQTESSKEGAVFTVNGSFGSDRVTCSFEDGIFRVERGSGCMIIA